MAALALSLATNKSINNLNLSYNHIGDEGMIQLANAILVCKVIKSLDISNNKIGNKGAQFIGKIIKEIEIVSLNIGHNIIGIDGACSLADGVTENTSLKTIDIRFNTIGKEGTIRFLKAMADRKLQTDILMNYDIVDSDLWKLIYTNS